MPKTTKKHNMKKIILCLALGFSGILANAQEFKDPKVPSSVKDAFSKLYPNAIVDKWQKENDTYEAEFQANKTAMSASFYSNGKLIQTEEEIDPKDLPQGVRDYVTKNLNDKKIREASKIKDENGHLSYEAEINGEDYIFDSDCKFLKKDQEISDND
jgi:hypothetical protein